VIANEGEVKQWRLYTRPLQVNSSLIPTLSIIANVSKSTGILMLNGENDSQTLVLQAFYLKQRLTACRAFTFLIINNCVCYLHLLRWNSL
jgi:hypothetical protein